MKDLIFLVADKSMEEVLRGGLERPSALGIRKISYEIFVHPERDPGVRIKGNAFLRNQKRQFHYGVMMLDFEGSGTTENNNVALEESLNDELTKTWQDSAISIVIEPEVDAWIWGADNAIERLVGWQKSQNVRSWLATQDFEFNEINKPLRPKEAIDAVLKECNLPRSSSLYKKISSAISIRNCQDASFIRLLTFLTKNFPPLAE